jgi:Zn-dependent protease with chaperone function
VIDVGSLVGFAAAFVIVAWGMSALLCGGALASRRLVARRGPHAERAVTAAALLLAPTCAALFVSIVGGRSVALAGADHCAVHAHHPHLCLVHGGAWVEVALAVVFVAMVGAYLIVRACQLATNLVTARRGLRRIATAASEVKPGIFVTPATTAFCFTAGIQRPRIYVSSATWDALPDDERAAVLAHEHAHIEQRDVAWRALLGVATLFGAPFVARVVLDRWERATERACDQAAAGVVEPEVVAGALVHMSRLQLAAMPGLAFGATDCLDERVEALLDERPHDHAFARRMWCGAVALFVVAAASALIASDPIHHALETLLGVF